MISKIRVTAAATSCLLTFSTLQALGSNCTEQAIQLQAKSECYYSGDPLSCETLSLLQFSTGAGAVGGAATGYLANLFVNRKDMNERILYNLQKTRADLTTSWVRQMSLENIYRHVDTLPESHKPGMRSFLIDKLIRNDPDLKRIAELYPNSKDIGQDVAQEIQKSNLKDLKAIFPNEPALQAGIEKIQARMQDNMKAYAKDVEKARAKYHAGLQKITKPDGSISAIEAEALRKLFYQEKSVIYMKHDLGGKYKSEMKNFAKGHPSKDLYLRVVSQYGYRGAIPTEYSFLPDIKYFENHINRTSIKNSARVVGASLLGTAVGIAAESRGQLDIRSCAKELKLSDDEVTFLTNDRLLGSALVYAEGGDCNNFTIADPAVFVAKASGEYGPSFTPGICRMIESQSKKLDAMLGSATVNPKTACGSASDTNFKVTGQDFEFKDGGRTYKTVINKTTRFPDFKKMQILNEDGTVNKSATIEFSQKYSQMHPANRPELRPDITDINMAIHSDQKVFPKGLVQSGVRARILSSYPKSECDAQDSKSKSGTPEASGQSSSR